MLSLDEHSVVNFESHPSGWNCYPTGQNGSLELIFAKFATAKNREKLNPLKVSSDRCYVPKYNTAEVIEYAMIAPQMGFIPLPLRFTVQAL